MLSAIVFEPQNDNKKIFSRILFSIAELYTWMSNIVGRHSNSFYMIFPILQMEILNCISNLKLIFYFQILMLLNGLPGAPIVQNNLDRLLNDYKAAETPRVEPILDEDEFIIQLKNSNLKVLDFLESHGSIFVK